MFICNPTTPAQMFHLLRRQMLGGERRPLICLTPKYLLRHPECVSQVQEFEKGSFQEILDDPIGDKNGAIIFLCSGKIYYELANLRKKEMLIKVFLSALNNFFLFQGKA